MTSRWPRESPAWYGALALLLLAAVPLRVYHLSHQNIWFDEAYSWKLAQLSYAAILREAAADVHPPLYYFFLKWWIAVAGTTAAGLRSLSLVASLVLMMVTYVAGRNWAGERAALWALMIMAVSPHQIFYAQEARMYALTALFVMLAVYFYDRWVSSGRISALASYTAVALLAVYTHYFAILLLLAIQCDFALRWLPLKESPTATPHRRRLLLWLGAHTVMLLCYLPWLPALASQTARGQAWRHRPTWLGTLQGLWDFLLELMLGYFSYPGDLAFAFEKFRSAPGDLTDFLFLLQEIWMYVAGVGLLLFLLAMGVRRPAARGRFLILFGVPVAVAAVFSLRQSLQLSRYLNPVFPFFALILGSSIAAMTSKRKAWMAGSALAVAMLLGVGANDRANSRDSDYRPAAARLEEDFLPGDRMVIRPSYMSVCLEYYLPRSFPAEYLPDPGLPRDGSWDLGDGKDRLWIISDYRDPAFHQGQAVEDKGWIVENAWWWPRENPKVRLTLLKRP
ncbi:MAG: glycosyltransferase family 39 protein [Acidobacteria bacterium]|nr:glycosyltransferase family 39 protein [Acidobacteriota bacterium]